MKISEYLELSERERDAIVAREVMGWYEWDFVDDYEGEFPMFYVDHFGVLVWENCESQQIGDYYFHPTSDWNAMRLVVEKMEQLDWLFGMNGDFDGTWFAWFSTSAPLDDFEEVIKPMNNKYHKGHSGETAPEAVCIAALLALGKLEE